jgi:hypothetical protein
MSSSSPKPRYKLVLRVIGEFLVISIGVFVGLAADAAWDSRQLQEREGDYLRALRMEMTLAREELIRDYERREGWQVACDSILQQLDGRTVADSALNVWIQQISMSIARFNPPSAVLTDLLSSGNLSIISSDDLRYSILGYQQLKDRLHFLEDWARGADEDGLRPYLTQHFGWWVEYVGPPVPIETTPSRWSAMLADPEFKALVRVKRHRLHRIQTRSRQLLSTIDEMLAMIDGEIG